MKTVVLINPQSNRDEQYRLMKEIQTHFNDRQVIIEKSKGPGYVEIIAKKYALEKEAVHLFACGGDGTLHEVANAIAGYDHITLTPIPMGRGNDFVKSFDGLEKEDFFNFSNYKNPVLMDCDVLKVNGEYAINTVSLGFDVQVASNVNRFRSFLKGKGVTPYYAGMLAALKDMKSEMYDISIDQDQQYNQEYLFVVFCNGKYYGGGYQPCPDAKLDDGMLDMCLIQPIKRRTILQLSKLYQQGHHVTRSDLATLSKGRIANVNTHNKPVLINLDGEIREMINPTVQVVKKALHLALPRKEGE